VGRVSGHRGTAGAITVRAGSEAPLWERTQRFAFERDGAVEFHDVEWARAYRDRLVLKLRGIDDAQAAAGLRGARVSVARSDAPCLPPGRHYVAELVGLEVVADGGRVLGVVQGVVATGGTDLLRVARRPPVDSPDAAGELLIPLAREIVVEVDPARGRIVVDLPEGLEELNR